MIDFENKKVFKLSLGNIQKIPSDLNEMLTYGEEVFYYYTSIRDYVVFTDKRIIACNVQGVTGMKKDFTSIPYSKIQTFSIETAGAFDIDSELTIVLSGLGEVIFDFTAGSDIRDIAQLIAAHI